MSMIYEALMDYQGCVCVFLVILSIAMTSNLGKDDSHFPIQDPNLREGVTCKGSCPLEKFETRFEISFYTEIKAQVLSVY